jgi:hypothetical protein
LKIQFFYDFREANISIKFVHFICFVEAMSRSLLNLVLHATHFQSELHLKLFLLTVEHEGMFTLRLFRNRRRSGLGLSGPVCGSWILGVPEQTFIFVDTVWLSASRLDQ